MPAQTVQAQNSGNFMPARHYIRVDAYWWIGHSVRNG